MELRVPSASAWLAPAGYQHLEEILRHLLPAFGLGVADRNNDRTDGQRRMFKWAVLFRQFGREPDLFLDADAHDHVQVINTGGRDSTFDEVSR